MNSRNALPLFHEVKQNELYIISSMCISRVQEVTQNMYCTYFAYRQCMPPYINRHKIIVRRKF